QAERAAGEEHHDGGGPHPFSECHHSPFWCCRLGRAGRCGRSDGVPGAGRPVRGSCAVRYPCLPGTPADRPAGGVTAPSRLTRVVNGGWLPRGRRSEQHTGTTPTTTDRNGELFIPGPAR